MALRRPGRRVHSNASVASLPVIRNAARHLGDGCEAHRFQPLSADGYQSTSLLPIVTNPGIAGALFAFVEKLHMLFAVLFICGLVVAPLAWLAYAFVVEKRDNALVSRLVWTALNTLPILLLCASIYSALCPEVVEKTYALMPLSQEPQVYAVAAPLNYGELYFTFTMVTSNGADVKIWPVRMISIVEDSTLQGVGYFIETRSYPSVGFGSRIQNYDVQRRELRVPPGTLRYTFQNRTSGSLVR